MSFRTNSSKLLPPLAAGGGRWRLLSVVAAAFVPLYADHLGSTVVSRAPSAMDKIVLTSCAGWLAENGDKGLRFNKPLGHSANRKTSPALLQVDDHVFLRPAITLQFGDLITVRSEKSRTNGRCICKPVEILQSDPLGDERKSAAMKWVTLGSAAAPNSRMAS